jgi:hypothetical protein
MKGILISILLLLAAPVSAITDEEIVTGLEALGDLEAAWPLALNLAQQRNDYSTWRKLAEKYAKYDPDDQAYVAAWNAARGVNTVMVYQDFLSLRQPSPYNALAVHRIFELKQELDTIQGYLDFIKAFPNSVEAVAAMLRIHEIAFERAGEADSPEVYDTFVKTFPEAKQVPQAIEQAYQAELRALKEEAEPGLFDLAARFYSDEHRERIARRVYNEGRVAEQADDEPVMDRKYRLLGNELFRDTQTFTAMLDRDERLAHQQRMAQHQERIQGGLNTLREALVAELQLQGNKLEAAILEHNRRIKRQFTQVYSDMNQGFEQVQNNMNQGFKQVYGDMNQGFRRVDDQFGRVYGHINAQMGQISRAIEQQAHAARKAAYQAQAQQDRLFRKAQEEARFQSYQNRRCAEALRRRGRYTAFSGCP